MDFHLDGYLQEKSLSSNRVLANSHDIIYTSLIKINHRELMSSSKTQYTTTTFEKQLKEIALIIL
jgi:hypothetical protein